MELQQVHCFVVVAEEGHLRRAAERLGLPRSALAHRIRELERELRTELFDPALPEPRLTAAGDRFLPEARMLLAAEERARAVLAHRTVAAPRVPRRGPCASAPARAWPDTWTGCWTHSPGSPRSSPSSRSPHRPRSGRRWSRPERWTPPSSAARPLIRLDGLRHVPLWQDPLVAAVPARHPLAASPGTISLAELAGVPLVLTDRDANPPLVDLVTAAFHDVGFTPCRAPARLAGGHLGRDRRRCHGRGAVDRRLRHLRPPAVRARRALPAVPQPGHGVDHLPGGPSRQPARRRRRVAESLRGGGESGAPAAHR
ncbi:LysR family transcriptional regulator [Streptomyces albulus]|nr:LysR family transcriptional regulator [Streptomyces noursei]